MNLPVLFDSIILNAQGARSCYFAGREDEAFVKLEQCQRTIAALREFRDKVHALLNADPTPPPAAAALRAEKPPARRGRPPGSGAKPKPPKAAPTPPAQPSPAPPPPAKRPLQRLPSAEYPPDLGPHASLPISPYHTANDVSDDGDTADLGHPSPAGATELVPDFIARLDEVFFGFLARVCSDLNATDSEGERIHQTQTAKRLQGVSESDFNAFKFRIRPFINAFREELQSKGFTPDVLPEKLLKLYLAQQRYISRFNEEGRKAKSKGTHVWMVEAKKTADGGFIFREFERKIVGPEPPAVAHVGSRFRYEPRIFDPQTSSPKVTFKSPNLPDWLRWESNVLTGIVPPDAMPVDIQVLGHYRSGDDGGFQACLAASPGP
ncbi:hypothetical protein DFJ74DRAFT_379708 [Hyaloraphidium curvatum]|nr:hypothetical protein DFJ74DRAFT_379708 [Hyaloraphidium curvatum]